jgi:Carboxypeptidase regulatory-like domain
MKPVLLTLILFGLQWPIAGINGSIQGFVQILGTSTPIASARVDVRNDFGGPSAQVVTTDANGQFQVNLPPGRYRVLASADGYVPARFGERGIRPAPLIEVGPGQEIKNIVVALTPKSTISGHVYDQSAKPVANARVQAMRHVYQDGRRILVPIESSPTDDLGAYRLVGLVPGPYIISSVPVESSCAGGCAVEETLLPVYFPGTTDASAASPIDLPPGINFTGVDLRLAETRAVSIRGRVTNAITNEPAAAASVTLVPRRGTAATGSFQKAIASAAGTFEFRHIAPGSYEVISTGSTTDDRLAASVSVDVGNEEIDGLTLSLLPQLTIAGRIRLDNASGEVSTFNLGGLRVELRREPYTPELLVTLPTIRPDGTFTLTGVTPGDYRLKIRIGGPSAYIKSARYGSIDALNAPFHIGGPGELQISVSQNSASLDGFVGDDSQRPIENATVVLVPNPPRRDQLELYYSTASDVSGRVHFDGIAPGDYRVFAWEDVPADAWQDPDFIRSFEDRAAPVHLDERGLVRIQVRLIQSR